VADLEVSVHTALPIVIMSEMMPINDITALTWQHDLIATTSQELVLGHSSYCLLLPGATGISRLRCSRIAKGKNDDSE
jgi:hypothetical protein